MGRRRPKPPPQPLRWRLQPPVPQRGSDLRIVRVLVNTSIRGEQGDHRMWVTAQTGERINFSRMEGIWTQFYPRIDPSDPDESYDVMCEGASRYVLGRYGTEGRALQILNEVIDAETNDVDYTMPVT